MVSFFFINLHLLSSRSYFIACGIALVQEDKKGRGTLYYILFAQLLNPVWLFETPMDLAPQAPLSMGLSRQEYWRELPFPPPEDLPNPGIQPTTPAQAGGFFHHWVTWEVPIIYYSISILACWKGFFFFSLKLQFWGSLVHWSFCLFIFLMQTRNEHLQEESVGQWTRRWQGFDKRVLWDEIFPPEDERWGRESKTWRFEQWKGSSLEN